MESTPSRDHRDSAVEKPRAESPSASRKSSWSCHPMVVLSVGTVLSAALIPWLNALMNDRRLINDARLQRCLDILKNTAETNQRLHTMMTTTSMFIKDNRAGRMLTPLERQQVRRELNRQYLEFDQQAWWWWSRLPTEARLLRIEFDAAALDKVTAAFQKNLYECGGVFDRLWGECLRTDAQSDIARVERAEEDAKAKLAIHLGERHELTGQLVRLFAPSEPPITRLLRQIGPIGANRVGLN